MSKPNFKILYGYFIALLSIIGTGTSITLLAGKYIGPHLCFFETPIDDKTGLLIIVFIAVCMFAGVIVGTIPFILLMRPFFSREEIKSCFTEFYVPVVSPFMIKILDIMYTKKR